MFVHNFERNEWEVVTVLDSDGGSQAIYGIDFFVLQVIYKLQLKRKLMENLHGLIVRILFNTIR